MCTYNHGKKIHLTFLFDSADEQSRRSCELFNGDSALPVYQWTTPNQQYKVEELGKILIVDPILSERMCTKQPVRVINHINGTSQLRREKATGKKGSATALELGTYALSRSFSHASHGDRPRSFVCKNASFVVDLHSLDDPQDMRADENGVWQRNGSPVAYVSIHNSSGNTRVLKRSKMGHHSHHFKLTRTYYRHTSSPDFTRIITTVHGKCVAVSETTV